MVFAEIFKVEIFADGGGFDSVAFDAGDRPYCSVGMVFHALVVEVALVQQGSQYGKENGEIYDV